MAVRNEKYVFIKEIGWDYKINFEMITYTCRIYELHEGEADLMQSLRQTFISNLLSLDRMELITEKTVLDENCRRAYSDRSASPFPYVICVAV
jgi:hypothetical protein